MPAPGMRSSVSCSWTRTRQPLRAKERPVASPAMPPPAISTLPITAQTPLTRLAGRYRPVRDRKSRTAASLPPFAQGFDEKMPVSGHEPCQARRGEQSGRIQYSGHNSGGGMPTTSWVSDRATRPDSSRAGGAFSGTGGDCGPRSTGWTTIAATLAASGKWTVIGQPSFACNSSSCRSAYCGRSG